MAKVGISLRDLPADTDWELYPDPEHVVSYQLDAFIALVRAAGGKIVIKTKDLVSNGNATLKSYHDENGNLTIEVVE